MPWMEQFEPANWAEAGWIALGAYALGCFTTGYYLVRMWTGQDLRELGSGNVGAKNVGRVLGKTGFFLTLLADFGKGAFTIWAARHFTTDPRAVAVAALAVVAGHIWPVQLLFRGGKGMATSLVPFRGSCRRLPSRPRSRPQPVTRVGGGDCGLWLRRR